MSPRPCVTVYRRSSCESPSSLGRVIGKPHGEGAARDPHRGSYEKNQRVVLDIVEKDRPKS
jgi:hypothetical protein